MNAPIVLVTSSAPVRDAVERVLARLQTPVRHESSAASGAAAARESASVVISTLEVDWQGLIKSLNTAGEIGPPIILLLPQSDARLWVEALMHGAFDAVSMTDGPERIVDAVEKARSRWLRARSVREALKQNTYCRYVA